MQAMVFLEQGKPLVFREMTIPEPLPGQVLVKVLTCGICRTDLHVLDGELTHPKLPLILGHEIIGTVVKTGEQVTSLKEGDLVGIPWLGYTCGTCRYCRKGMENLCENALFTGYTIDGGYAEYTLAFQDYCFPLASSFSHAAKAPLLCAGLIGYRSYNMIDKSAKNIGIYGFGAAAHILVQIAAHEGKHIYAFTRDGDTDGRNFALKMGAVWAGDASESPGIALDAAIIFAPAGALIPKALRDLDKGGTVICGGIHMSDVPSFPYDILWGERSLRSVANLTRKDAHDFFSAIKSINIQTETQVYPLQQANEALDALRAGKIQGAAVLLIDPDFAM